MTSNDPVSLTIAFSEGEDRLILVGTDPAGAPQAMLLTRRLTARLINGIAGALERSNIVASSAPEEMRSDIVLMEHQVALAGAGQGEASPASADETPAANQDLSLTPALVTNVKLVTNPQNFELVFGPNAGAHLQLVLNRLDLHRFLEVLKRQAEHAGWNLQIDAEWLGDDQSLLTVN